MSTVVSSILQGVVALALVTGGLRAQAAVSGTIALVEREGADRGDLRGAVVYLEARGRFIQASNAPALQSGTIEMRGREFIPHVRVVRAGGIVAFPNKDPFSHNVFSSVELGPFDLGLYRRNESRAAPFAEPGVYPIYCNIHSRMVSFVVAVPTSWVAQPEADGRFVLRGVPAGSYLLHAWHERGVAEVRREITIPPGGMRDLALTLDARTYVPAPHLNKLGLPYSVIRNDRY